MQDRGKVAEEIRYKWWDTRRCTWDCGCECRAWRDSRGR